MLYLLFFIYSFIAAFILTVVLRSGMAVLRLAWWVVKKVLILLWRLVRWLFLLALASVRSRKGIAL